MSNIFQDVLTDVNGVQQRLLGPDYKYYDNINSPDQIGMSDNGDLGTLANDVDGLISYVELLVQGSGNASKTGQPLGNKFFLNTGGKCVDPSGVKQDRYIYVNNVPQGNIPFISSAMGQDFSDFRGLIPGTISKLEVLNPYAIMQSFLSGSTPPCQQISMQTIDVNNNSSSETHYVTTVDIQNMDACLFPNGQNPVTGQNCVQGFQNMKEQKYDANELPEDPLVQIYYASLAALVIYMIYRIANK